MNERNFNIGDEVFINGKTYEQGLDDGTKIVEQLFCMSFEDRNTCFGTTKSNNGVLDIIKSFTGSELKEIIELFEQRNLFNIGDVIILHDNLRGVVTYVHTDKTLDILLYSGQTIRNKCREDCKKTGENIDISKLLEVITG